MPLLKSMIRKTYPKLPSSLRARIRDWRHPQPSSSVKTLAKTLDAAGQHVATVSPEMGTQLRTSARTLLKDARSTARDVNRKIMTWGVVPPVVTTAAGVAGSEILARKRENKQKKYWMVPVEWSGHTSHTKDHPVAKIVKNDSLSNQEKIAQLKKLLAQLKKRHHAGRHIVEGAGQTSMVRDIYSPALEDQAASELGRLMKQETSKYALEPTKWVWKHGVKPLLRMRIGTAMGLGGAAIVGKKLWDKETRRNEMQSMLEAAQGYSTIWGNDMPSGNAPLGLRGFNSLPNSAKPNMGGSSVSPTLLARLGRSVKAAGKDLGRKSIATGKNLARIAKWSALSAVAVDLLDRLLSKIPYTPTVRTDVEMIPGYALRTLKGQSLQYACQHDPMDAIQTAVYYNIGSGGALDSNYIRNRLLAASREIPDSKEKQQLMFLLGLTLQNLLAEKAVNNQSTIAAEHYVIGAVAKPAAGAISKLMGSKLGRGIDKVATGINVASVPSSIKAMRGSKPEADRRTDFSFLTGALGAGKKALAGLRAASDVAIPVMIGTQVIGDMKARRQAPVYDNYPGYDQDYEDYEGYAVKFGGVLSQHLLSKEKAAMARHLRGRPLSERRKIVTDVLKARAAKESKARRLDQAAANWLARRESGSGTLRVVTPASRPSRAEILRGATWKSMRRKAEKIAKQRDAERIAQATIPLKMRAARAESRAALANEQLKNLMDKGVGEVTPKATPVPPVGLKNRIKRVAKNPATAWTAAAGTGAGGIGYIEGRKDEREDVKQRLGFAQQGKVICLSH